MAPKAPNPVSQPYHPWCHSSELALVCSWFFPQHTPIDPYSISPPDMRQSAISHVQMWAFKDPKLAHAIIATANLTDAIIHDSPDRQTTISDWALRSIYAMAFCRFVNGFVDRDVAKAASKVGVVVTVSDGGEDATTTTTGTTTPRGESSMYAHAAAIGMPERFVDLRHQATHDEMPSLVVLRRMAEEALGWLWERWWKVNAAGDIGRAVSEREESRLLGEKKAEARGIVERQVEAGGAAINSLMDEGLGRIDHSDDQDSALSTSRWKRKRQRGQESREETDAEQADQHHDLQNTQKHRPARRSRGTSRSAFGLFEAT